MVRADELRALLARVEEAEGLAERLMVAFEVMQRSGHGGARYVVSQWYDGDRSRPIPWESGASFRAWAAEVGIVNVGGTMRLASALSNEQTAARLKCTVNVMPDASTRTHLQFARGVSFLEGRAAVETAIRAIESEISASGRCPANRQT